MFPVRPDRKTEAPQTATPIRLRDHKTKPSVGRSRGGRHARAAGRTQLSTRSRGTRRLAPRLSYRNGNADLGATPGTGATAQLYSNSATLSRQTPFSGRTHKRGRAQQGRAQQQQGIHWESTQHLRRVSGAPWLKGRLSVRLHCRDRNQIRAGGVSGGGEGPDAVLCLGVEGSRDDGTVRPRGPSVCV